MLVSAVQYNYKNWERYMTGTNLSELIRPGVKPKDTNKHEPQNVGRG
jgi:hypothetical protein